MPNESIGLPPEDHLTSFDVHHVTEPHKDPEQVIPQIVENMTGIYSKLGAITEPTKLPFTKKVDRPIRDRAWRAKEYNRLFYEGNTITNKIRILLGRTPVRPSVEARKEMAAKGEGPLGFNREERNASVKEKAERTHVSSEYLKQGTIDLEFSDLGKMGATFVVMNPLPEKLQQGKPTVVLLAGLDNAAASVSQIADQLVLSGRKVVILSQPESAVGIVNPKFAAAVQESADFTPHARYFRAVMDALAKKNVVPEIAEKMELWAYSSGCASMARALTDPAFSKRVESAVFIAPAASAKVSMITMRAVVDFFKAFSPFKADTPAAWGGSGPQTKEHTTFRVKVRDALAGKFKRRTDLWEKMKVGDGGPNKVAMVTYDQDYVTNGAVGFPVGKTMPNPQMKLIAMQGKHLTPSMPEGARSLIAAVTGKRRR